MSIAVLALTGALVGGCGGSGGTDTPNPIAPIDTTKTPATPGIPTGPNAIPANDAQAVALLDTLMSRIADARNAKGYAKPESIVTLVSAGRGVHHVRLLGDGSVAAIIPPGIPVTFVNNLLNGTSATIKAASQLSIAPAPHNVVPNVIAQGAGTSNEAGRNSIVHNTGVPRTVVSTRTGALLSGNDFAFPSGGNVRVFDGRGPAQNRGDVDYQALYTAGAYANVVVGPASIDALSQVNGADVVMLKGHGGMVELDTIGSISRLVYGFMTSDKFSVATKADRAAEWKNGELRVACAHFDDNPITHKAIDECHFVITPDFIRNKHWRLHEGSLAFLSMCGSASTKATDFRQAIFDAGAAGMFGWTDLVDGDHANLADAFAVDYMLGTNFMSPRGNPLYRPFPWSAVKPVLDNLGYTKYRIDAVTGGPATGEFGVTTEMFLIVDPATQYGNAAMNTGLQPVLVDTQRSELSLSGVFGSSSRGDAFVVKVNGRPLTVKSSSPTSITAQLTSADFGDVTVETTDKYGLARGSNFRVISRWAGVVSYTHTYLDVLQDSMSINTIFRADVGNYWTAPRGVLQHLSGVTRNGVVGTPLQSDSGSVCAVSTKGMYAAPSPSPYRESWALSGLGSLPISTSSVLGCVATMFVPEDPSKGGAQLGVFARSGNVKNVMVTELDGFGQLVTTSRTDQIIFVMSDVLGGSGVAGASIPVNSAYAIASGSLPRTSGDGRTKYLFSWAGFSVQSDAQTTRPR